MVTRTKKTAQASRWARGNPTEDTITTKTSTIMEAITTGTIFLATTTSSTKATATKMSATKEAIGEVTSTKADNKGATSASHQTSWTDSALGEFVRTYHTTPYGNVHNGASGPAHGRTAIFENCIIEVNVSTMDADCATTGHK